MDIRQYLNGKRAGDVLERTHSSSPKKNKRRQDSRKPEESSAFPTPSSFLKGVGEDTLSDISHQYGLTDALRHAEMNERRTGVPSYDWKNSRACVIHTMRTPVVDWLFDVCVEFELKIRTLHIAINLLDRFLALARDVQSSKLQLVGICSLWIASKFEEIDVPSLESIVWVSADEYSDADVIAMETTILQTLNWEVAAIPLVEHLRLNIGASATRCTRIICEYVSMLALYDFNLLAQFPYSMIARAIWVWVTNEHVTDKAIASCVRAVQVSYHSSSPQLHPAQLFIQEGKSSKVDY